MKMFGWSEKYRVKGIYSGEKSEIDRITLL